jgi:hypothetical protein
LLSGFRGEDFLEIDQPETRIATLVNGVGQFLKILILDFIVCYCSNNIENIVPSRI